MKLARRHRDPDAAPLSPTREADAATNPDPDDGAGSPPVAATDSSSTDRSADSLVADSPSTGATDLARAAVDLPRTLPERRVRLNAFQFGLLGMLGVGVGLVLFGAAGTLRTIAVYVGVAFFLGIGVEPVLRWAVAHRVKRWIAVLLLIVSLLLIIAGILLLIIPSATAQLSTLITNFPAIVGDTLAQPWAVWIQQQLGAQISLDEIGKQVTAFFSDPNQLVAVGGGLLAVGSTAASSVEAVAVVSILTLYFTLTMPTLKRKLYQAVPRSRREGFRSVAEEIFTSVGRYVAGQLFLALVNSLFTFLVVSVLRGPAPVILAIIAFVGALIPVVGTLIGSTIVSLAILTVSPINAIIAIVVLLIYMQVEAYVLSPRVMSKAVSVPGVLVIIGALAGAALGGILGAFVAVPVLAAIVIVWDRVFLPRQEVR